MIATLAALIALTLAPATPAMTEPPEAAQAASAPMEVAHEVGRYIHDVEVHEVGAYLQDVAAHEVGDFLVVEQARVDTELAPAYTAEEEAQGARPATSSPTGSGAGECTGFAIPDYIIQRESGGNAFIQNPSSDAFGCAQTLLGHYNSGASCGGLDPYTIEGQRQCVWILSEGGTNLAPWALTR